MGISLCPPCFKTVSSHLADITEVDEFFKCVLCFGLMDPQLCSQIIEQAKIEFEKQNFDGNAFILAVNLPVSQVLREKLIERMIEEHWMEQEMSPKSRFTFTLMNKFRQVDFLRPSLQADTIMTVTFENDEFDQKDIDYFMCHMPREFLRTGKKRQAGNDESINEMFTKMKVLNLAQQLNKNLIDGFNFASPSKMPKFQVSFEREQVFIAARYCKYSRSLPQSPWAPNKDTAKVLGNSVGEKITNPLQEYFRADSTKFIASGREDIDVRMLGTGRPFAVALFNARKWQEMYDKNRRKEVLSMLRDKINKENKDVEVVGEFQLVTQEEMRELNIGQEEKRKQYSALCYSCLPITLEMAKKFEAAMPVELNQATPIRVLIRRSVMDRKRMIYAGRMDVVDEHHFRIQVETQAGTYVKEFVNGDFGRTRPSVANLLGFELADGVSILN